jgi:hypothetical protein
MTQKSLDQKLARIHADPHGAKDFILADAKDADMAFGIGAPGQSPEAHTGELRYRSLAEYRANIEQIVEQGLVDIMLMSASTSEVLTLYKRIFDKSNVTPAARANDTTDVHVLRGGKYLANPSLPFRSASLDHIQCGHLDCAPEERQHGVNLGLYSITFNNDTGLDRDALEEYKAFRLEAEHRGFRHFLEVFDPNQPNAIDPAKAPGFINDAIARTLAGVTSAGRPLFLKMVYHGPKAMEELVQYDPHLVIGILGGGAGTTYDAFKLLSEARKYGARVALYGRKINHAENQLAFIHLLRYIADGEITAEEGVRAYHGVLENLRIKPHRSLEDDMVLHTNIMSYGGNGVSISLPPSSTKFSKTASDSHGSCSCSGKQKSATFNTQHAECSCPTGSGAASANGHAAGNGTVNFSKMTTGEKIAYHRARWNRILG